MSIAGNILQAAVSSALQGMGGGGSEWMDMALDLCGNAGQVALVESIGSDFDDIWELGVESYGDFSAVGDLSDHPDAISDILAEVEGSMDDKFNATMQDTGMSVGGLIESGLIDMVFG